MRGKDSLDVAYRIWGGITPAHAGKSYRRGHARRQCQDHPRPCGEKLVRNILKLLAPGSPPPMRGKVYFSAKNVRFSRITPAHAGKSDSAAHDLRRKKDHPRPCGEKLYFAAQYGIIVGSPPPMRGKADASGAYAATCRITPAHAGKSGRNGSCGAGREDHPRPCGEKREP